MKLILKTSFILMALIFTACDNSQSPTAAINRMAPVIGDEPKDDESPTPEVPFGTIFRQWGSYDVDVWLDMRYVPYTTWSEFDKIITLIKWNIVKLPDGHFNASIQHICEVTVKFSGNKSEGSIYFYESKVSYSNIAGLHVNQPCPEIQKGTTANYAVYGNTLILGGVEYPALDY